MAALVQRIEAVLAGITEGSWRAWTINLPKGRNETISIENEACDHVCTVSLQRGEAQEWHNARFIAAVPALLRECAAILRGLDDAAVGKQRLVTLKQDLERRRSEYDAYVAKARSNYVLAVADVLTFEEWLVLHLEEERDTRVKFGRERQTALDHERWANAALDTTRTALARIANESALGMSAYLSSSEMQRDYIMKVDKMKRIAADALAGLEGGGE